jgi:uncharacterized protein (TIGR03790 family)
MPWKWRRVVLSLLLSTLLALVAHAGGGPQNVAVVVNPNDPDSLAIANYYIELRHIPPTNVFYIPWRADLNATTGVQFRDRLLKPLLTQMDERGVRNQIHFLAFSSGFPYLVDCAQLFPGEQFPPQARPLVSLTAAGFFYQHIQNAELAMFGIAANEYFSPAVNGVTTSRAFAAASQEQGPPKHFLCTALGVTLGHGNTGSEITAALRRAKEADGKKPRGTIYYMQNKDVRSRVRDGDYAAAVRELAALSVKAAILPGVAPPNKPDVAGLTTGAANVDLKGSGSKLLPGALVDNLTSAGGQMLVRQEANPQTRISEYIRLGAAGASGAVIEPYAIPHKFPSAALHVHYARGCSLAEAYYQSVQAPFHLLIIGDPLCQPWAVAPSVAVSGIADAAPLTGTATIAPSAKYPDARKASRFELYVDGIRTESVDAGDRFELDTTKLANGVHELRVIAVDNTPIAVQGAWMAAIQVQNGDGSLKLQPDGPLRTPLAGAVTLEVASSAKADAHIMHNGRRVAAVAGGTGKVEIAAKLLGKGRSHIYAVQAGAAPLRSQPVVVEVQ